MALFLAELFSKILYFLKTNVYNASRSVKLIGLAILWFILKPKKHDSVKTMPGYNYFVGHFPLVIKHWRRLNEFAVENVSEAGWPQIGAYASFTKLSRPIITIYDPKIAKFIFDTKFDYFIKGPHMKIEFKELLGDGIFASDPPEWKFHRKVASRMFSMRNLKNFMFECTVDHSEKVLNKIDECDSSDIDIYDMLSRFTLDCFTSIAFGHSVDSLDCYPAKHPFAEAFDDVIARLTVRHFVPFRIWKVLKAVNAVSPIKFGNEGKIFRDVEVINDFADKVLHARESKTSEIAPMNGNNGLSDESGSKHNDILSLFLKYSDSALSKRELKYIAMNMIIAGRDTTRLLLSWFLYEMTQHKNIREKVYEEIDRYDEHEMTYDHICNSLLYTECVLLEALRMHPVVPFLLRQCVQDIELPDDNKSVIRKGDEVIIPTYAFARNPNTYQCPLHFNPNRFFDKLSSTKKTSPINVFDEYQYPFFNINPRLCLGRKLALMEAKVFVFKFFKKYRFEMADPNQNISIKTGVVLNMEEGLRLKLTKRK